MRSGTIFFLGALVAAITIYDVVAAVRGGRSTISSVILTMAYTPPRGALLPLLLGFLLGHLLWPQRAP